jgi:L-ascorbate metabolism protein UlaG (beta-lactamase superfamily)
MRIHLDLVIILKITWIGHSCFLIESGGKLIYTDPFQIPSNSPPADVIFASHDHNDHFNERSLKVILKSSTEVVLPSTVKPKAGITKVIAVKPGQKGTVAGFPFEAVPAYNPAKQFHPKANGWCGYIIEIEGKKIFHAGDTDNIPEFAQLRGKIDVALLPVGDKFTMGFVDAIKAVGVIQPKIMIPMHQWDSDLETFKTQCSKVNPNVKIEILTSKILEI